MRGDGNEVVVLVVRGGDKAGREVHLLSRHGRLIAIQGRAGGVVTSRHDRLIATSFPSMSSFQATQSLRGPPPP